MNERKQQHHTQRLVFRPDPSLSRILLHTYLISETSATSLTLSVGGSEFPGYSLTMSDRCLCVTTHTMGWRSHHSCALVTYEQLNHEQSEQITDTKTGPTVKQLHQRYDAAKGPKNRKGLYPKASYQFPVPDTR